jgi:hypothetical protein
LNLKPAFRDLGNKAFLIGPSKDLRTFSDRNASRFDRLDQANCFGRLRSAKFSPPDLSAEVRVIIDNYNLEIITMGCCNGRREPRGATSDDQNVGRNSTQLLPPFLMWRVSCSFADV